MQLSLAPVDIGVCRAGGAGAIFTIGKMYVYLPDTLRHDSRAAPDHSRKIGKRHIASAIGIAPASEHIKCRVCIKLRTAIIAGGTQIGYVSDHINGARFPALRWIEQEIGRASSREKVCQYE